MIQVVIGIGIPGSGKTTFLVEHAKRIHAVYICPDEVRFELTGSDSNQSQNGFVWEIVYGWIDHCLRQGDSVIVDATNAKPDERKKLIDFCSKHPCRIKGYWFQTPLDECIVRNASRQKQVPEPKIREMHKLLANFPPSRDEGFDYIIRI